MDGVRGFIGRYDVLRLGFTVGVLSATAGYVVTGLWLRLVGRPPGELPVVVSMAGAGVVSNWTAAAWLFFGAHGGPLVGAGGIDPLAVGATVGALVLVPPLVLVPTGVLLARVLGRYTPLSGARAGAGVVVGYLPLLVGLATASHVVVGGTSDPGTVGPELAPLVVGGGLVALAFGALGGALGSRATEDPRADLLPADD